MKFKETLPRNIRNTFISKVNRIQTCSQPGFLLSPLFLLLGHTPCTPPWRTAGACVSAPEPCASRGTWVQPDLSCPATTLFPDTSSPCGFSILPLLCKQQGRTKIQMRWWNAARAAQTPQWFFQLIGDCGFTLPHQEFFSPSYPV